LKRELRISEGGFRIERQDAGRCRKMHEDRG
jgi:hypothetical protein